MISINIQTALWSVYKKLNPYIITSAFGSMQIYQETTQIYQADIIIEPNTKIPQLVSMLKLSAKQ